MACKSDDGPSGERRRGTETDGLVSRFLVAWAGAGDAARAKALKILYSSGQAQEGSEPSVGYEPGHDETSPRSS